MIPVMLLLLQSAQQVKQAANVIGTLQQPHVLPEWIKTLITASVGALVGFISSVLLEFLKPYIAKRLLRRTVRTHLVNELKQNTGILELTFRLITTARSGDGEAHRSALKVALRFVTLVSSDRYTHYFTETKDVVYELDKEQSLALFYRIIAERFPPQKPASEYTFGEVNTGLYSALIHARRYLKVRGEYPIPSHIPELEVAYLDVVPESDDAGMAEKIR